MTKSGLITIRMKISFQEKSNETMISNNGVQSTGNGQTALTSWVFLFLLLTISCFSISLSMELGKDLMVVSILACLCFCCWRKQARSSGSSALLERSPSILELFWNHKYKNLLQIYPLLAHAAGIAIGHCSGGSTKLVTTISVTVFISPPNFPPCHLVFS